MKAEFFTRDAFFDRLRIEKGVAAAEKGMTEKMETVYLTIGSVTHAIMGRDLLRARRITARVVKTPPGMDKKGCGYSLLAQEKVSREAVQILKDDGITVTGVYRGRF